MPDWNIDQQMLSSEYTKQSALKQIMKMAESGTFPGGEPDLALIEIIRVAQYARELKP